MIDYAANWAESLVDGAYDDNDTAIDVIDGSVFPVAPFNVVWWNVTDYPNPADDPNREIVRVTEVATNTLTVTRAQEGSTASTKNTGGKTYKMVAGPTAKLLNEDIAPNVGTNAGAGVLYEWDDLLYSAGGAAGAYTKLGPGFFGEGSGSTWTFLDPIESNHPGIVRLLTGGTDTAYHRLQWFYAQGSAYESLLRLDQNDWEAHFIFRMNHLTEVDVRVGFQNYIVINSSIQFSFNTDLDSTIRYQHGDGSTTTYFDTAITPGAGDWYHFRIRAVGDLWECSLSIDGAAFANFRTFGPSGSGADTVITAHPTALMHPICHVGALEAVEKSLDVDLFSILIRGLNR